MGSMQDIGERLRAQGRRMTPQRRRVLEAVSTLGHATPEDVVGAVGRDGGPALSPSTVYRALDALEALGAVAHTHLDHRAPVYHPAEHADHIHLVCRACGRVDQCEREAAISFVEQVRSSHGFVADLTHMAVHGWCSTCAGQR